MCPRHFQAACSKESCSQDLSRAEKVLKKRLWERCVGETHSKMCDVLEPNENLEVQRHNQVSLLESFVGSYFPGVVVSYEMEWWVVR